MRRRSCLWLALAAAVVLASGLAVGGEDFEFAGGALTTTNGSAWGGISRTTYGVKFDFSAGPTEIEIVGLDLTETGYSGTWTWPPTADDQGAQARFGITGNGFWSLHSVHSAFATGGSWDQQSAAWDHDDGFRKYLIQNQYSGWTTGTVKGNHQYNVEAYIPRDGAGPSVNDESLVTDRAYNTFDLRILYTPTGTPGQYVVQGWVRLYKAASTTEMATRPGSPTWGSPYSWVWNKAINNQASADAAWVPFYDGTWNISGDFTSAQPFVEIMNWGVAQTSPHSLQWATLQVSGTPALVYEAWADDDWIGLANGVEVSGHYIGYDAFEAIQPGVDQLAGAGATLHVAPGTYREQVTVDADVAISGSGATTVVEAPDTLTNYFLTGTSKNYPIIYIHDTDDAEVSDLVVDGRGVGNANVRFVGIGFYNAGGTVDDVEIKNIENTPFSGSQHGTAIYAYNADGSPRLLTVSDSSIHDFQKNGMALIGAGLTVNVVGNTVAGIGPTTAIAQNGIQVTGGAGGQILNNVVRDIWWVGDTWTASGILVGGTASDLEISGNDIVNAQTGVYAYDTTGQLVLERNQIADGFWNLILYNAPNAEVHYNAITGSGEGSWTDSSPDATLNWWGSALGPTVDGEEDGLFEYNGGGETLYGNFIYSPWLGTDPDGDAGTAGVQITGPVVIVVDDVGPAPAGGYLDAAIGGSNDAMLPYEDAIIVMDGDYTVSTALTDGVTLTSDCGACKTSITGSLAVNADNTTIGRIREGFAVHGPITIGTGVDAGTIHINWNDIYGSVTNDGTGRLDATFNYWGADGPETTGIVDTYPILPVSSCVLISYIDEYGLRVMEAITFARLLERGLPVGQAKLAAQIAEEYGLGIGDVMALIREYGLGRVRRAYFLSDTLDEFLLQLAGYRRDIAGGGGGVTGDLGSYPVGASVPLSYALMAPFSEEPAAGAIVSYTLVRMIERPGANSLPIPELIRLGVLTYDADLEAFVATLDTTGLEPGSYEVWIGADDGWSTKYALTLTE